MAEDNKQALIDAAWKQWFHKDYAWHEQPQEPVPFHTLEDSWRTDPETNEVRDDKALEDAGELIRHDGQKPYHIALLPLHYEDGTPTRKLTHASTTHEKLMAILRQRLSAAADPEAPLAHFRGIVVGGAFDLPGWEFDQPIRARLIDAIFAGPVNFLRATFAGDADFSDATFLADANFGGAIFNAKARFVNATFAGGVDFDQATFKADANFYAAKFAADASFLRATFLGSTDVSGIKFTADANFHKTTFAADADFSGTIFAGKANLNGATFTADADFNYAVFTAEAAFNGASFAADAHFKGLTFKGRFSFGDSRFVRVADFGQMNWPKNPLDHHVAFLNATFHDLADFTGSGFRAFAAFDGARFQQGLRFDKAGLGNIAKKHFEASSREQFNTEQKAASGADGREQNLEQLESGCRVLKQEMAKQGDKSREQLLYKFELLARRAQHSTPGWEKVASYAYETLSDYGGSVFRPILWLKGVFVVFALVFWTFLFSLAPSAAHPHIPPPLHDATGHAPKECAANALTLPIKSVSDQLTLAAELSASRIFPFGPFDDVPKRLILAYDCDGFSGRSLVFRLLATLESFLALTLAFLSGLSVRRRFQIN